MKLPLTIALTMAFLTSQAQTDSDSLKVAATDSVAAAVLPDSLGLVLLDSSLFMLTHAQDQYITSTLNTTLTYRFYIPTCKELESRKGLLYYFIDGTAIPYCGQCVETTDNEGVLVLYYEEVATLPNTFWPGTKVKSISTYKDGLRHGSKVYFDKKGKHTKIETYENGKLVTGSR
jgi:hypothetical protein